MLILRAVKRRRSSWTDTHGTLILRRSEDDYHGANGDSATARVFHSRSSSCLHESRLQQQYRQRLLTTAQVRKDTQSLIDLKGLGRPKEFSGKEEDFPQWSEKTEAFFAEVIKESEVMLE